MTIKSYDVAIVGAGMVGLACAHALAALDLQVVLLETRALALMPLSDEYDVRVSAITPSSVALFKQLHIWPTLLASRVTPFTDMLVWDEATIHFSAQEDSQEELGFIIENSVLQQSLLATLPRHVTVIAPVQLQQFTAEADKVHILTDQGQIQASLLIGADGVQSWVRQQAGITVDRQDYQQQAIVATVKTALPHRHYAYQRFLPTGPLAFLPLPDPHHASIVWTVPTAYATELLALAEEDFAELLTQKMADKVGVVNLASARYNFVLQRQTAQRLIGERVVLIGDAAHVIHPLAGQGVNLGFKDVQVLGEVLQTAKAKQQDIGQQTVLRCYERRRKADIVITSQLMSIFNKVFSNEKPLWRKIRNRGLAICDRIEILKQLFKDRV